MRVRITVENRHRSENPFSPAPPAAERVTLVKGEVHPASPYGPPMMHLPAGLMSRCVGSPNNVRADLPFLSVISWSVFFKISYRISLLISSRLGAVASGPV